MMNGRTRIGYSMGNVFSQFLPPVFFVVPGIVVLISPVLVGRAGDV